MEEMIESSVGTFGESVTIRRMSAVILCEQRVRDDKGEKGEYL